MNIEQLRECCLSLKGTTESMPFDDSTLVIKVQNKMFALIPLNTSEQSISLKCEPERAIILREEFSYILPAWHFNKKHWNMIMMNPNLSESFMNEMIKDSYNLVVAGLPKKLREELERK